MRAVRVLLPGGGDCGGWRKRRGSIRRSASNAGPAGVSGSTNARGTPWFEHTRRQTVPRSITQVFRDPTNTHVETKVPGRGTSVKTNDVTGAGQEGRIRRRHRDGPPALGASYKDVEKMTMALARHGIVYEACNRSSRCIADESKGTLLEVAKAQKVVVGHHRVHDPAGAARRGARNGARDGQDARHGVLARPHLPLTTSPIKCPRSRSWKSSDWNRGPTHKINLGMGRAAQGGIIHVAFVT